MRMTSTQLKKIIAEEVARAAGRTRLTEAPKWASIKERVLDQLNDARLGLVELDELTDDADARSAVGDLDQLIEFVTMIDGTTGV